MSSQQTTTRLREILVHDFGIPAGDVTPEATFEALGLDSLDLVELTMIVDEQVGVKLEDEDLEGIATVRDAVEAIEAKTSVTA